MICYQDEKMYGPPANGMDEKTLEEEIKKLEKEIYGDRVDLAKAVFDKKKMIYDVNLGRLIPNYSVLL